MATYIPPVNIPIRSIPDGDKYSNQRVLEGTNPECLVSDGIFFLEYLKGSSVSLKDGDGNTVVSSISDFQADHAPIRFDHGIIITGSVTIAKGFIVRGMFP